MRPSPEIGIADGLGVRHPKGYIVLMNGTALSALRAPVEYPYLSKCVAKRAMFYGHGGKTVFVFPMNSSHQMKGNQKFQSGPKRLWPAMEGVRSKRKLYR